MNVTVEKSNIFKGRWWLLAEGPCGAICWDGMPFSIRHTGEDVAYFSSAADARRFARCQGLSEVTGPSEATAEPDPFRPGVFCTRPPFKVGDRVRIVEGPCLGLYGKVEEVDGNYAGVFPYVDPKVAQRHGGTFSATDDGRLLVWCHVKCLRRKSAFKVGDRVRITGGPHRGCVGSIELRLGNSFGVRADDASKVSLCGTLSRAVDGCLLAWVGEGKLEHVKPQLTTLQGRNCGKSEALRQEAKRRGAATVGPMCDLHGRPLTTDPPYGLDASVYSWSDVDVRIDPVDCAAYAIYDEVDKRPDLFAARAKARARALAKHQSRKDATKRSFRVGDRVRHIYGGAPEGEGTVTGVTTWSGAPACWVMFGGASTRFSDWELKHAEQPRPLRVGDRVRLLTWAGYLDAGAVGTVKKVEAGDYQVLWDQGSHLYWMRRHELKMIEPAKRPLRVGDRVRITSALSPDSMWTGRYGRVDNLIGAGGAWVVVDGAGSLPFDFMLSELELANA